jgi:hypothetical protein
VFALDASQCNYKVITFEGFVKHKERQKKERLAAKRFTTISFCGLDADSRASYPFRRFAILEQMLYRVMRTPGCKATPALPGIYRASRFFVNSALPPTFARGENDHVENVHHGRRDVSFYGQCGLGR